MWWKNSVVYQIYPRSFKDSNGDGIGDLQGIISKLDYLAYLGIDVIWLCPVYQSPNEDNGYDISDYKNINYEYGTMKDIEMLIEEASKREIKIMMDIVANHTSSEHKWFKEARENKNSPYHDYYIFKKNKGNVPSDLQSIFLDSAWEYNQQTNEYYLHMFAKGQPDLNWHHKPVRDSIFDILQFWVDKGIKGFRFDVIDLIAKEIDEGIIGDGPKLHEYIKEMTRNMLSKADLITVGETWGATVEKAKLFSNKDGSEFSMIFNFEHILLDQQPNKEKWDLLPLDLIKLKEVFKAQQQGLYNKGWNSLFWNNHDLPRIVSRWGNDKTYHKESAKMLATLLHFMQGTPYIYQGEEIGMTNMKFKSIDDYRDIETLNLIKTRKKLGYSIEDILKSIDAKGRDNTRTPYQWNDKKYAGFSDVNPWILVNNNHVNINLEKQIGDQNSILEHYRKLIYYRRHSAYKDIIEKADFNLLYENHTEVFAYERTYKNQKLIVLCNFYDQKVFIDDKITYDKVLITNQKDVLLENGINLRPYEAIVLIASNQQ